MPGISLARARLAARDLCAQRIHPAARQRPALKGLRCGPIGGLFRLASQKSLRVHFTRHLLLHRGHLRLESGLHMMLKAA